MVSKLKSQQGRGIWASTNQIMYEMHVFQIFVRFNRSKWTYLTVSVCSVCFDKCRRHLDSYKENLRLCGKPSLADVSFWESVIYFRGLLQPVQGLSIIMMRQWPTFKGHDFVCFSACLSHCHFLSGPRLMITGFQMDWEFFKKGHLRSHYWLVG